MGSRTALRISSELRANTPLKVMLLLTPSRWANPVEVKGSLETIFTETFGTKNAAAKVRAEAASSASKPQNQAKAPPISSSAEASSSTSPPLPTNIFREGLLSEFHKPGDNPQVEARLKEEHLKWTKGMVYTRFPPEPNGFLHVGEHNV